MKHAAERYDELRAERDDYLQRARRAGDLTLPYLIDQTDDAVHAGSNHTQRGLPWSDVGQRGVNNLASRLMLALLPPTEPNFRYVLDDREWTKYSGAMLQQGIPEEEVGRQRAEVDKALAAMERATMRDIEKSADRNAIFEAFLHLVVAGNVVLYDGEHGARVFPLSRFVLRRGSHGQLLELVTCELVPYEALDKAVQQQLADDPNFTVPDVGTYAAKACKVFTWVKWEAKTCTWHQEVERVRIRDSEGRAPANTSPWFPLRLYRIDGSPYGPGYVEAVAMAGLNTAEAMTQAVTEGMLIAAQTKFGVKPTAVSTAKTWADAENGAYVPANPEDTFPVQAGAIGNLQVAAQALQRLEARISTAFMLPDIRDSERTTALEVQYSIQQIENALGAVYSILTVEFLQPYVTRKLSKLTGNGGFPSLPEGLVRPVVSAGLASVGRGNEFERLFRFMQTAGQFLGPEAMAQMADQRAVLAALANSLNLDATALVKSEQQIAEEQQAAAQAAMQQQALSSAVADPQKLANAAATVQQMQQPQPPQQ